MGCGVLKPAHTHSHTRIKKEGLFSCGCLWFYWLIRYFIIRRRWVALPLEDVLCCHRPGPGHSAMRARVCRHRESRPTTPPSPAY